MSRKVLLVLLCASLMSLPDAEAGRRRRRRCCVPSCVKTCVPPYAQTCLPLCGRSTASRQLTPLEVHPRTCPFIMLEELDNDNNFYYALLWPTDCNTAEPSFLAGSYDEPQPCEGDCVYLHEGDADTFCPFPDGHRIPHDPRWTGHLQEREPARLIRFTTPDDRVERYAYAYFYDADAPRVDSRFRYPVEVRYGFETATRNTSFDQAIQVDKVKDPNNPGTYYDHVFHVTTDRHIKYVVLIKGRNCP